MEKTADVNLQHQLTTYNLEDCLGAAYILERVIRIINEVQEDNSNIVHVDTLKTNSYKGGENPIIKMLTFNTSITLLTLIINEKQSIYEPIKY